MGWRLGIESSMSQRSWRQNLAQGKRSGTKWSAAPPWVIVRYVSQSRFSGRQILSPAKAGSTKLKKTNPGFRSLRSLHPGLNSAASFAGSLSCSMVRRFSGKRQTCLNVLGR